MRQLLIILLGVLVACSSVNKTNRSSKHQEKNDSYVTSDSAGTITFDSTGLTTAEITTTEKSDSGYTVETDEIWWILPDKEAAADFWKDRTGSSYPPDAYFPPGQTLAYNKKTKETGKKTTERTSNEKTRDSSSVSGKDTASENQAAGSSGELISTGKESEKKKKDSFSGWVWLGLALILLPAGWKAWKYFDLPYRLFGIKPKQ